MRKISFNIDNVGGVAEIYAFPPADLLRLRHDYATGADSVELLTRENIVAIPVYPGRAFHFSEEKSLDDGGCCWSVSIEGVIPGIDNEHDELVGILERGEWLVLSMDNNGTARLSGTQEVPLQFSSTRSSGEEYAGLAGTEFSFQGVEPEPSAVIDIDELACV